jgi:hypothetical protein
MDAVASAPKTAIDKNKKSELAAEIVRDFGRVSADRGGFESQWKEIAERMIPSMSPAFSGTRGATGEKRTNLIFDSTAAIALSRFAAILDSLLTPRNQTWHALSVSDESLAKNREVRLYFEAVNRILFRLRYAPKANFSSQNQQNWRSLGGFGTGALFTDRLQSFDEVGLRYRNIHLGEVYFTENHQGLIDCAYRRFPLSARQAFQKWGDSCPDAIKDAVKSNPEREFYFIHRVKPNNAYDPDRIDAAAMPYHSCHVAEDGAMLMDEGGYTSFPYAISRYEQSDGEIYGRSPAMEVLPAVKTLNEMKKTMLKQGHRAVDPVLLAHDDGIVDTFSMKPGFVNAGGVTADGRPLVHALPVGNIAIGKDLMDDERRQINDPFLVSVFQILMEGPQRSATEVLELAKEKGILLAPTVGRQQSEYLSPLIERELDIASQLRFRGKPVLPPMPEILREAQGQYRVTYNSPLSRSQRAEEASGVLRTVESALNVVNVTGNAEPLDHFNWDVIMPQLADIHGVPVSWMNSAEKIAEIREARQGATDTQTMIQGAPAAAAMMKASAVANKGK